MRRAQPVGGLLWGKEGWHTGKTGSVVPWSNGEILEYDTKGKGETIEGIWRGIYMLRSGER